MTNTHAPVYLHVASGWTSSCWPRGHVVICKYPEGGRGRGGGRLGREAASVLLLSVGDDVHQVLVVQVARHVRGEGYEHLVDLRTPARR